MKTVLVTGGAGFIGSNLCRSLLERGYRVVCVDNFDDTYDPALKEQHVEGIVPDPNFSLERADVRDMDSMRTIAESEKPAYIVHLAAKADTRNAVEVPHIYTSINIDGTINIFELAKEYGVENLVFASSSSVYGNTEEMPWREDQTADRPLSPYGATKRADELMGYSYHHNFGLNITALRYFNAYGENNRPNMVPYIWGMKMLKGEEIEISGDGSRRRDYTYIGDIVEGTIRAMEKPLGFEVFNLGNSEPVSLKELLSVFEKVTGIKANVKSRPSSKASVEATYADVSKAKEILGWEPTTTIEEGITKLVTWLRNNRLEKLVK
jgi:UDP-glucuronate 4-epimerase